MLEVSAAAPPEYFPTEASELAFALVRRASWAAFTFSAFPTQAFKQDVYKALPYEKLSAHGLLIFVILFISFRLREDSSSF